MKKKKLKLSHSLFWILSSTIFISGVSYFIYFQYMKSQDKKYVDEKYFIKTILQTGNQKEALKTEYLLQLLDISVEKKISIFTFDEKKAEEDLLKSPLIKTVSVKKIKPSTLYIDYSIKEPIARLYDFENMAIDKDGYLFSFYPFFTPKKLPMIYLKLNEFDQRWFSEPLEGDLIDLAFRVLEEIDQDLFQIKIIDVSRAFSDSYGKRELIITIEEEVHLQHNNQNITCKFPKVLRLGVKNYQDQFANYLTLREKMLEDYQKQILSMDNIKDNMTFLPKIIDLRISKLAFIQDN